MVYRLVAHHVEGIGELNTTLANGLVNGSEKKVPGTNFLGLRRRSRRQVKVLYHGPRNILRKRVGTLNSELIIQYYDLELSVDET